MKMEQCSATSAYKIQALGNYPEESVQQVKFEYSFIYTVKLSIIKNIKKIKYNIKLVLLAILYIEL